MINEFGSGIISCCRCLFQS